MANFSNALDVVDTWVFRAFNHSDIANGETVAEEIAEREPWGTQGISAPFGHQPIPWRIRGEH